MFVRKSHYIRTHVVGGGGISDTITNIVKRITGNTAGDLASKLVVSAGKSMASEAGKRLATRFIAAPQQVSIPPPVFSPTPSMVPQQQASIPPPQPLTGFTPQNAVNHQAKLNEIIGKYNGSGVTTRVIPTTQHNAITIQDLVRNMHQGSGLKVI
jgi:hypothetical protein